MKKIASIAIVTALLSSTAFAEDADKSWHFFSQSQGGTISLLHGLSKETCEFVRKRALNIPATEREEELDRAARDQFRELAEKKDRTVFETLKMQNFYAAQVRTTSAGDIMRAECFQ